MASMTNRICQCCKKPFKARTADVNRGWAKFCSKRCKALEQESRTGQYKELLKAQTQRSEADMDDAAMDGAEDGGWDAHKSW